MKTALFLGSGASAFMGMPTTKELVDRVMHQVSRHEEWENPAAQEMAEGIVFEHESTDVEYLYQTIRYTIDVEERHRTVVEYKTEVGTNARKREIVTYTAPDQDNMIPIGELDDIDENIKTLKSLETAIRNVLFNMRVQQDEVKTVVEQYDKLFQYVPRRIITTNYDNVLEAYCEQKKLDLVNGFKKTHLGYERVWDNVWESGEEALHLIKLHGSITWQKDDDAVVENGRPCMRDPDKDVMIVPTLGEKDYKDGIFCALWDRFKETLAKTELLIVVGFSFRDTQVNDAIRSRLEDGMRMVVFSPTVLDDIDANFKPMGLGVGNPPEASTRIIPFNKRLLPNDEDGIRGDLENLVGRLGSFV